jgi:hypothetical protein
MGSFWHFVEAHFFLLSSLRLPSYTLLAVKDALARLSRSESDAKALRIRLHRAAAETAEVLHVATEATEAAAEAMAAELVALAELDAAARSADKRASELARALTSAETVAATAVTAVEAAERRWAEERAARTLLMDERKAELRWVAEATGLAMALVAELERSMAGTGVSKLEPPTSMSMQAVERAKVPDSLGPFALPLHFRCFHVSNSDVSDPITPSRMHERPWTAPEPG